MSSTAKFRVKFRPHHFLCTVGFEGKGYSDEFVANYGRIAKSLEENTSIEIVGGSDSICAPCPNRRGEACETEEKISKLDQAHARILDVKPGETMTWGEAKSRIRKNFNLENFHSACAPCSWLKSGMCEKALKKLKGLAPVLIGALSLSLFVAPSSEAAQKKKIKGRSLSAQSTPSPTKKPNTKREKSVSASMRALNRAYEAWEKRDTASTLKEAHAALSDPECVDHAKALLALASLRDSETRLEGKNAKGAIASAKTAIENFTSIRETQLYSPWWNESARGLAQSELALASAYAKNKEWKSAMREFDKAFQRLAQEGGGYLITSAHLETYSERCKKSEDALCKAWVVKYANTYSKNSAESRAIAKSFPDIVETAKPNFANSKITMGYKQKDADDAAFEEAFKFITKEEWGDASDAFKKFLEDYSRSASRFRAKYWLAHALDKRGHSEDAKKIWEELYKETPLTHYGILASWKLNKPLIDRFSDQQAEPVTEDPFQTPIEAARLTRVRKLITAKAYGLAAKDLRSLRPRDTASGPYLLYLAELSNLTGAHLTAFSMLSDLIQRSEEAVYSKRVLDFVFPSPDWGLIQKLAKEQDLDPILVLSLIKQESAFERDAQSSVGASGYMQLMPFTASDTEPDVQRRDLILPENNIRVGTKYLKKVLNKFNGNIALALAAYNSGPTTVDRWMKEGKSSQGVFEFIEQIPYKETRDYVGTIFRNYVWYKKRIENVTIVDASDFWKNANASPNPSIQVVSASKTGRKPAGKGTAPRRRRR